MQPEYGFCECGCGERTSLARQGNTLLGHVRGEPVRFRPGHALRSTATEWAPEDRGYKTLCHVWQRSLSSGYGLGWDGRRLCKAHRLYWEREHGPVPAGLVLDHLCEQRDCIREDHLEPVTQGENMRRAWAAKRRDMDTWRQISLILGEMVSQVIQAKGDAR